MRAGNTLLWQRASSCRGDSVRAGASSGGLEGWIEGWRVTGRHGQPVTSHRAGNHGGNYESGGIICFFLLTFTCIG